MRPSDGSLLACPRQRRHAAGAAGLPRRHAGPDNCQERTHPVGVRRGPAGGPARPRGPGRRPGKDTQSTPGLHRPRRRRSATILVLALGARLAAHGHHGAASRPRIPALHYRRGRPGHGNQPLKGLTMNTFTALSTSVIPNPTPVVPAQAGGLLTILNWASGIGLVLGVLGVIIVGIGMVIQLQRGEGAQAIGKLGWVLMGCIIITGASGIVRAFV